MPGGLDPPRLLIVLGMLSGSGWSEAPDRSDPPGFRGRAWPPSTCWAAAQRARRCCLRTSASATGTAPWPGPFCGDTQCVCVYRAEVFARRHWGPQETASLRTFNSSGECTPFYPSYPFCPSPAFNIKVLALHWVISIQTHIQSSVSRLQRPCFREQIGQLSLRRGPCGRTMPARDRPLCRTPAPTVRF